MTLPTSRDGGEGGDIEAARPSARNGQLARSLRHSLAGGLARLLSAEVAQALDELLSLLAVSDHLGHKRRSLVESHCRGATFRSDFSEPFGQPSEHVFKLPARDRVFDTFGFGTGALN